MIVALMGVVAFALQEGASALWTMMLTYMNQTNGYFVKPAHNP
jgi:hypothetical protein